MTKQKELTGVKEIARRANISIATVDRVLNNRTGVSEKTKEKINLIIKELNYQPNILARRLASKKIIKLAVLIPAVSAETDYWEAPLMGINKAALEIKPYGIVVDTFLFDQNNKESFHQKTKEILKLNVDAVLMAPMFIEESREFVRACQLKNIPYIFINADIPDTSSLSYIGPNLYHSGYLGAHLMHYLIQDADKILLVNISKEIDNHHHLLRKEEGFRAYYKDNGKADDIVKIDIRETAYLAIKKELLIALKQKDIKAIFVTNSRVAAVARFLAEANIHDIILIGYDFIKDNIEALKKGSIDFLICQKPLEQGYLGIMNLYYYLLHGKAIDKTYFMPIDIITKENYQFYRN